MSAYDQQFTYGFEDYQQNLGKIANLRKIFRFQLIDSF